jgi:chloramphenicol-sensitive protein RarD
MLIATTWFVFIYAVDHGRVIEVSLGYFINPLVNVSLGLIFLGERLRRAQLLALLLATLAVINLTLQQAELPWISLTLAFSFALYGLLRKRVAADALTGLTVETLILFPLAILWLNHLHGRGELGFGRLGLPNDLLLIASGVVTALPLLWFANAARRLPLSTIGFLQYLAPSIQFLLAVLLFGEHLGWDRLLSFGLIWVALAIFSWDLLRSMRRTRATR